MHIVKAGREGLDAVNREAVKGLDTDWFFDNESEARFTKSVICLRVWWYVLK